MQKPKKPLPNFVKYSSMAFQMGVIIFAAAFGGMKLDDYITSINFPVFTIVFTIVSVFAAVYLSIKDIIKINKD